MARGVLLTGLLNFTSTTCPMFHSDPFGRITPCFMNWGWVTGYIWLPNFIASHDYFGGPNFDSQTINPRRHVSRFPASGEGNTWQTRNPWKSRNQNAWHSWQPGQMESFGAGAPLCWESAPNHVLQSDRPPPKTITSNHTYESALSLCKPRRYCCVPLRNGQIWWRKFNLQCPCFLHLPYHLLPKVTEPLFSQVPKK